jgi:hypothetical protein
MTIPEPKQGWVCPHGVDHSGETYCPTCLHEASTPEPELNVERSARKALIGDFNDLYVPRFTTDYQAQRLVRATEIAVMSFPRLLALIQQVSDQRVKDFAEKLKLRDDMHNGLTVAQLGGRVFVPVEEVNRQIDKTLTDYLSHKEAGDGK